MNVTRSKSENIRFLDLRIGHSPFSFPESLSELKIQDGEVRAHTVQSRRLLLARLRFFAFEHLKSHSKPRVEGAFRLLIIGQFTRPWRPVIAFRICS
jgi:hypothetical protein